MDCIANLLIITLIHVLVHVFALFSFCNAENFAHSCGNESCKKKRNFC